MSIETLLAAAEYLEKKEKKQLLQATPVPPPPPQSQSLAPPPQVAPLSHVHQPTVVLHQVLQPQQIITQHQQQSPAQHHIPIQHVTIQHAPTKNGHGHILSTQPVNTIRIHHKKDVSVASNVNHLPVMNSFDLINPAVIDQGSGEVKRKQPPMAFRTGTREVHNKLEKNRRAHLKDCFEELLAKLPNARDAAAKKTSNLQILDSALKCIKELKDEAAARQEEMEQLAKKKIGLQQRYSTLRKEIKSLYNIDVPDAVEESHGATTARLKRKRDRSTPPSSSSSSMCDVVCTAVVSGSTDTVTTEGATPFTAGTGTTTTSSNTSALVGNVLKLPKSITAQDDGGGGFTFTGYPANGGLVLVPKVQNDQQHQQLTAQFVSAAAQHQHHHHDNKVIVNAQYVVKPLVVVSTPSRTS